MKKLIIAVMIAITGWINVQAQSSPAPEKYNSFLEQMAQLEQVKAEFMMKATLETLAKDPKAYRQMLELAEKRFSDAADPIHNEGLYMTALKHATDNFILSAAEKERQRLLLEGAKKNMIGSTAADFDYITPNDKTVHHLKDLRADYILIYFNNPDCESCETVKERLNGNELINQMVNDKKLIVLAIYPYDDQKLWKKAKYPKMMINGWNQSRNIEYAELYDLPTLPCFYLVDKQFKVIVKNEGSLNKVEAKLKELTTAMEVGPAPAPATAPATASKATPKIKVTPAPADDPKTIMSEQVLTYMIENKSQEIYDLMSEKVKEKVKPTSFDGAIAKIESKMGKYQGHEPWQIQHIHGNNAYTTLLNFEKSQLSVVLLYDEAGKVLGFNLVPAEAIKRMN